MDKELEDYLKLFPKMKQQVAHLTEPMRTYVLRQGCELHLKGQKEYEAWSNRKRIGDPRKRQSCCDLRPENYGPNATKVTPPELQDLLVQVGTLMLDWVPMYDCKVCGQGWQHWYTQERLSGTWELKKV